MHLGLTITLTFQEYYHLKVALYAAIAHAETDLLKGVTAEYRQLQQERIEGCNLLLTKLREA